MKLLFFYIFDRTFQVAPYTGAWIETLPRQSAGRAGIVAPYTGAWIETLLHDNFATNGVIVAPYTGAWIETTSRQLPDSDWW